MKAATLFGATLVIAATFALVACDSGGSESPQPTDAGLPPPPPPPPPAAEATFEGIGGLSGAGIESFASAVSADGSVVVGSSRSDLPREAFRWEAASAGEGEGGEMVALGTLPDFSAQSFAMDVSSDGLVVAGVSSQDTQSRFIQSSRWRGGALEPLDRFADNQLAHAISSDGSVVVGTLGQEAFRWEGGDSERLGFLPGGESSFATSVSPNGSIVVGFARNADGAFQAFRWENGEMVGLESAPGEDSLARDVSADGSVVVGSVRGPAGEEAVRWVQDPVSGDFRVAERLGVLSADSPCSEALAISADGSVVVGYSGDTANFCHGQAFIWTEDEGMRGVRFVLETEHNLDLFGWTLGADISVVLDADISNDGTVIVGTGTNPDGEIEAWRAFLGAPATRLRR